MNVGAMSAGRSAGVMLFASVLALQSGLANSSAAQTATGYFGGCFNESASCTGVEAYWGSFSYNTNAPAIPFDPSYPSDGNYYNMNSFQLHAFGGPTQQLSGPYLRFQGPGDGNGPVDIVGQGAYQVQLVIGPEATNLPQVTNNLKYRTYGQLPVYSQPVDFPIGVGPVSSSFGSVFADGAVTVSTTDDDKQIVATFTPNFGISLSDAAALGNFVGFDWQQTVVTDPYPPALADPSLPPLTVPYPDPPDGGYFGQPLTAGRFPFYWDLDTEATSTTDVDGDQMPIETDDTLIFTDVPAESRLQIGQYLEFNTTLVGVLPSGSPCDTPAHSVNGACVVDLFEMSWEDNFNGTAGGAGNIRSSDVPADPGSGTGGITILSTSYPGVISVPEPGEYILISIGVLFIGGLRRTKRMAASWRNGTCIQAI